MAYTMEFILIMGVVLLKINKIMPISYVSRYAFSKMTNGTQ